MTQPTELLPCPTPCCDYTHSKDKPYPVYWNPYNKVVQCHNCGHVYEPCEITSENTLTPLPRMEEPFTIIVKKPCEHNTIGYCQKCKTSSTTAQELAERVAQKWAGRFQDVGSSHEAYGMILEILTELNLESLINDREILEAIDKLRLVLTPCYGRIPAMGSGESAPFEGWVTKFHDHEPKPLRQTIATAMKQQKEGKS